jgi:predicted DNA-binding transcriptional regulator AlpA
MRKRLRFRDLVALNIVSNRVTLSHWIQRLGFPQGQLTGPNSRTWAEDEVQDWIARRPVGPKAGSPRRGPSSKEKPPDVSEWPSPSS